MSTFAATRGRPELRALQSALLATLLLASCESSDPEPPDTPPPPTTPPLDPTVISLDDGHRVGSVHWPNGGTSSGGQGAPVGGLECIYPSPVQYHVHTHLSIFLDGVALALPAEVGIAALTPTTECHYPLHTHDATGLVHAHATTQTLFTLGQFFAVWGQPLQRDNVAGIAGRPVVVYVTDAGMPRVYTGDDLQGLQILSHREITIRIGTPIAQIPQFTWTGE